MTPTPRKDPLPEIGRPIFLVYRECPCGNWIATGEGALCRPVCHDCGGMFVPGGGVMPIGDGPDHEEWAKRRRYEGLGFAALLTSEMAASSLIGRLLKWLGLWDEFGPVTERSRLMFDSETASFSASHGHYDERGVKAAAEEMAKPMREGTL